MASPKIIKYILRRGSGFLPESIDPEYSVVNLLDWVMHDKLEQNFRDDGA